MKKIVLSACLAALFVACSGGKSLKLEVSNPLSSDRTNEMVEVDWKTISEQLALKESATFVVENEAGKQVPYQIIMQGETTPQSVIFPADVKSGGKATYTIKKGKPEVFAAKVFGRQVPERKDDFAWENDRIAFRMYGPALASENPSNGVDIWLKRTDEMILDKFYSDELGKGLSYHVDHGQGLDCYKVGHTLGAGGIAPYYEDSLWVGNHYDTFKVLDNGPLRMSFVLTYDSVPVAGKMLKQHITISLDAHSQLNKAVVSYEGDIAAMDVSAGIFLHKVLGDIKTDKEAGYIAYAENAVSDAGLDSGRDYVAVVFSGPMKDVKQDATHLLGLAAYNKGETFTYYFGAGWSKWGFDTDDAWFTYVVDYAAKVKTPLVVTVLK